MGKVFVAFDTKVFTGNVNALLVRTDSAMLRTQPIPIRCQSTGELSYKSHENCMEMLP